VEVSFIFGGSYVEVPVLSLALELVCLMSEKSERGLRDVRWEHCM
jgi:hypothetical protein